MIYHIVTIDPTGRLVTTGVRDSTPSRQKAEELTKKFNKEAKGGWSYAMMRSDAFRKLKNQ